MLDEPLDVVDGRLRDVVAEPRVVGLGRVQQLLPDALRAEAPAAVPAGAIDGPDANRPKK